MHLLNVVLVFFLANSFLYIFDSWRFLFPICRFLLLVIILSENVACILNYRLFLHLLPAFSLHKVLDSAHPLDRWECVRWFGTSFSVIAFCYILSVFLLLPFHFILHFLPSSLFYTFCFFSLLELFLPLLSLFSFDLRLFLTFLLLLRSWSTSRTCRGWDLWVRLLLWLISVPTIATEFRFNLVASSSRCYLGCSTPRCLLHRWNSNVRETWASSFLNRSRCSSIPRNVGWQLLIFSLSSWQTR